MAWVKFTDDFYDNPKFAKVGPLGLALWSVGIAYCNRNLTDGYIPRSHARTLLDFENIGVTTGSGDLCSIGEDVDSDLVIGWLVDAMLWLPVKGGYEINDYLEFQPSKAEVIELREKRSKAGAKGAANRWADADL